MEFDGFHVPFGLVAGRPRQAPNVLTGSAIIGLDSDSVPLRVHPRSLTQGRPWVTHFRRLGNAAWASVRKLANATPNGRPRRLAGVGRPDSHPLDGLARPPGLAMLGWRVRRPLAAPVCPSTAGCPLLMLATTLLLGPGSAQGPSRVTVAGPTRLDTVSSAWRSRLGQSPQVGERYAQWLAQASYCCGPARLAPSRRLGKAAWAGHSGCRTLGPLAAPVCPSTAGCRLSVLSRRVRTQPGRNRPVGELYAPCPAPVCSWRGPLIGDRF